MTRIPSRLVRLMLAQSEPPIKITASGLRNWTSRGHITHTPEGYDIGEIVAYLDKRHAEREATKDTAQVQ